MTTSRHTLPLVLPTDTRGISGQAQGWSGDGQETV